MASHLPSSSPSPPSSSSSLTDFTPISPLPRENTVHLTPQTLLNHSYSNNFGLHDPRTSSTQSLRPVETAGPNRRTLLLVYIHGFLGNETSFQSFPAHVHSLLSVTLADSHVVYSKIYPRYQSRKNISLSADTLSNWLAPHESDTTDVILVGHSLGGILGAEVVLIPSHIPGSRDVYQHRILGLIAFDTPFLGMHPGVVSTGIASLFRGAPESPEGSDNTETKYRPSSTSTPFDTTSSDPRYNPSYSNDVHLPVRANKWEKAWYFWNKHYGELRNATQSYVKSHLEFGGCLADYPGLKRRYDAVRSLENVEELDRPLNTAGRYLHRVRFVNYYTASTGRIKEERPTSRREFLTTETEMHTLVATSDAERSQQESGMTTRQISLQEHTDSDIVRKTEQLEIDRDNCDGGLLQALDPMPHDEGETDSVALSTIVHDDLPPIPPEFDLPSTIDESKYTDPDALRLARKENDRQMKLYEQSKKDRQKAIRDREKIVARREKQAQKAYEKQAKLSRQEQEQRLKDKIKRQSTLNPEHQDRQMREDAQVQPGSQEKKKRDRKFCSLPAKDQQGRRDPAWVRVYMEGMDEVVAHTSLFFISDTYAKLVGDTAERIEQWVKEDATTRLLLSEQTAW